MSTTPVYGHLGDLLQRPASRLRDLGMRRYPGAEWRGPIPTANYRQGGLSPIGVLLHIMQGTLAGTDAWFKNPRAQVSAHFGNGKDGALYQWVDTADTAYHAAAGNPLYIGIEHEGMPGDSLTDAQIQNDAQIVLWLHNECGVPFQLANAASDHGVGYHAMGGQAYGGHLQCPGQLIVDQRQHILDIASQETDDMTGPQGQVDACSCPTGGYWVLTKDGGVRAEEGAPFLGSYPGLPSEDRQGDRFFLRIEALPSPAVGYWIYGSDDTRYKFGS